MTRNPDLHFHKMHGAGNDFVLLDLRRQTTPEDSVRLGELASRLANRHLGIGCDQVLLLYPPEETGHLVRYAIRNPDGSEAGQCGNGARCIALYLEMNGETGQGSFTLESPSGPVHIERCADGEFRIDMGVPAFEPEVVPVTLNSPDGRYRLESPTGPLEFGAVSMGNPHAVLEVEDVALAPVGTTGPFLGKHPVFPAGCNIGFAEIVNRDTIRLRVYERGTGETLACGSGACGAVAVLHRAGRVNDTVNVFLPGGHLVIEWRGLGRNIRMKGPATHVFSGKVNHE